MPAFGIPNMPLKCDIYRPFGAGAPTYTDVDCNLVPALFGGEDPSAAPTQLQWDHWIDVPSNTDIRDGLSRSIGNNNWNYADGDKVRVKNLVGNPAIYFVVVFVNVRWFGTSTEYKRAYLLRDSVTWANYP